MSLLYILFHWGPQIEGDNEPQPSIPREEGQVPFVFVGTMETISNAKVLLEYHLHHLKVNYNNFILLVIYNFILILVSFLGSGTIAPRKIRN